MANNSGFDFLVGVTVGAVVGAAVGILLAPQSGEETRKVIAEKSKEAAGATKDATDKMLEKLSAKVDKLGQKVDGLKNKITDSIGDVFEEDDDLANDILGEDVIRAERSVETVEIADEPLGQEG